MENLLCLFVFTAMISQCTINGQLVIQRIRLVGSNNSYGRVEIQVNGTWGTVCDDQWDDLDASVVCRSLNFPDGGRAPVKLPNRAVFGEGTGPILLDEVACVGDENGLAECKMSPSIGNTDCNHAEDAGVICNPTNGQPIPIPVTTVRPIGPQPDNCVQRNTDVRLIAPNGVSGIGLVEVFNAGVWGSVCDDMWDELDARVVCAALCYDTSYARSGAPDAIIKDVTASAIIVDNVRCTGNEVRIQDCQHNPWNNHNCGPLEIASVTCVNLDSKAPDPPVPVLKCTKGYLIALFNRSRDIYLEEKHLTVQSSPTGCNIIKSTDADFITIRIPFQNCNTDVKFNATHILYSNTIKYATTHYDGNKIRVNNYDVHVYCDMPRNIEADRNLKPLTETVTKRAEGKFVINMTFYQNNSFTVPVSQYPVRMPLGEWLNVALQLESIDSRLKLVVPDCVATPTQDKNNIVRYPLFEKNCPKEPTLGIHPLSQIKIGYRYQPFLFVNNPLVYIHCGAFVCLVDENGAECDRSCNTTKPTATGRRKRDLTSGTSPHREKYYINSGPMMVYKPSNIDTVVERIDITGSYSTTITIPLPTDIQEKLSKATTKQTEPEPTNPTTYGARVKVTTTQEPKKLKSTMTHRIHEVETTVKATTLSSLPDSVVDVPTTTIRRMDQEGVWIEYPRRPEVTKDTSVQNEKEQTIQLKLRFGVSSATSVTATFVLLIAACVSLLLLFR